LAGYWAGPGTSLGDLLGPFTQIGALRYTPLAVARPELGLVLGETLGTLLGDELCSSVGNRHPAGDLVL
jgi:hypothetical protein